MCPMLRWTGETGEEPVAWEHGRGDASGQRRKKSQRKQDMLQLSSLEEKNWWGVFTSLVRHNDSGFCWCACCSHNSQGIRMAVPIMNQSELERHPFFYKEYSLCCISPYVSSPRTLLEIIQEKLILSWSWEHYSTVLNVIGNLCYLILSDFIEVQGWTIQ